MIDKKIYTCLMFVMYTFGAGASSPHIAELVLHTVSEQNFFVTVSQLITIMTKFVEGNEQMLLNQSHEELSSKVQTFNDEFAKLQTNFKDTANVSEASKSLVPILTSAPTDGSLNLVEKLDHIKTILNSMPKTIIYDNGSHVDYVGQSRIGRSDFSDLIATYEKICQHTLAILQNLIKDPLKLKEIHCIEDCVKILQAIDVISTCIHRPDGHSATLSDFITGINDFGDNQGKHVISLVEDFYKHIARKVLTGTHKVLTGIITDSDLLPKAEPLKNVLKLLDNFKGCLESMNESDTKENIFSKFLTIKDEYLGQVSVERLFNCYLDDLYSNLTLVISDELNSVQTLEGFFETLVKIQAIFDSMLALEGKLNESQLSIKKTICEYTMKTLTTLTDLLTNNVREVGSCMNLLEALKNVGGPIDNLIKDHNRHSEHLIQAYSEIYGYTIRTVETLTDSLTTKSDQEVKHCVTLLETLGRITCSIDRIVIDSRRVGRARIATILWELYLKYQSCILKILDKTLFHIITKYYDDYKDFLSRIPLKYGILSESGYSLPNENIGTLLNQLGEIRDKNKYSIIKDIIRLSMRRLYEKKMDERDLDDKKIIDLYHNMFIEPLLPKAREKS